MYTQVEAAVRELLARLKDFERQMSKDEDDAGALLQAVKLVQMRFIPSGLDCTMDFPSICACIPFTLPLRDTYYGDTNLTYDPANFWWRGCKQISYPGTSLCGAQSAPIRYTLYGDDSTSTWVLEIAWHGTTNISGNVCPTAGKVCVDTLNRTRALNSTFHCPPALSLWTSTGGLQGQIHPTGINPNLFIGYPQISGCSEYFPWTLYANDSVYGSWTLEFDGVNWVGCRTLTTAAWTGASPCAATATAVTLVLNPDGRIQVKWTSAAPGTTKCPSAGATCASTTNVTADTGAGAITINACDPFDATVTVSGATWKIFGDAGATITFSETP